MDGRLESAFSTESANEFDRYADVAQRWYPQDVRIVQIDDAFVGVLG